MKLTTITKLTVAAALLVCSLPQEAFAQYSYNYGGGKISRMHSSTGGGGSWSGLNNHENTYIPTGAINDTARGTMTGGVGKLSNPLLPKVPWGANVSTPGDNFYMGGAPDTPDAALPSYMRPRRQQQPSAQQMRQMQMMQRRKQEQGTLYVPGQNAKSAGGGSYSQNSSGAFTYE